MPISDNQKQDSASPSLGHDADKNRLPDDTAPTHTPSEVAMRLNVLGKLIIPPTSPG